MNTVTIGDIGEAIAISEFTKKGCIISKPLSSNARYDLIVEYNNKLYRVQVKTTNTIREETKMVFATKTTNYNKGSWKSIGYTSDDIDIFFLYCLKNNWCGLYFGEENGDFIKEITIRTELPKNNQSKKIRLADDYAFENQFLKL